MVIIYPSSGGTVAAPSQPPAGGAPATYQEGMTKEQTPFAQLESGKGSFAESAARGAASVESSSGGAVYVGSPYVARSSTGQIIGPAQPVVRGPIQLAAGQQQTDVSAYNLAYGAQEQINKPREGQQYVVVTQEQGGGYVVSANPQLPKTSQTSIMDQLRAMLGGKSSVKETDKGFIVGGTESQQMIQNVTGPPAHVAPSPQSLLLHGTGQLPEAPKPPSLTGPSLDITRNVYTSPEGKEVKIEPTRYPTTLPPNATPEQAVKAAEIAALQAGGRKPSPVTSMSVEERLSLQREEQYKSLPEPLREGVIGVTTGAGLITSGIGKLDVSPALLTLGLLPAAATAFAKSPAASSEISRGTELIATSGARGFSQGFAIGSVADIPFAALTGLGPQATQAAVTVGKNLLIGGGTEAFSAYFGNRPVSVQNIIANTGALGVSEALQLGAFQAEKGIIPQVVGSASVGGGFFGLAQAGGEKGKPGYSGALSGAAIGAALGFGTVVAEQQGLKFTAGRMLEDVVNPKTGVISQEARGVKFGIERIVPSTGEAQFYGVGASSRGVFAGAGSDVQALIGQLPKGGEGLTRPVGILESKLFGSAELQSGVYGPSSVLYYGQKGVNPDVSGQLISKSFPESEKILGAIEKSGGTIGGSVVEQSIIGPGGKPLIEMGSSRYAGGKLLKDIDVVFYGGTEGVEQLGASLGVTPIAKAPPLSYKGFAQSVLKYEIPVGEKLLDVTVMIPGIFEPVPAAPLGQFLTSGTRQGAKILGYDVATYTPQQQIASKTQTIGLFEGKVMTIEPGKGKYLQDIATFREAVGQQTTSDFAKSLGIGDVGTSLSLTPTAKPPSLSVHAPDEESLSKLTPRISEFGAERPSPVSPPSKSSLPSFDISSFSLSPSPPSGSSLPSPPPSEPSPSPPSPSSPGSSFFSSFSSSSQSSSQSSISSVSLNFAAGLPAIGFPPPPIIPRAGGGGPEAFGRGGKFPASVRDLLGISRRAEKAPAFKQPKSTAPVKISIGSVPSMKFNVPKTRLSGNAFRPAPIGNPFGKAKKRKRR